MRRYATGVMVLTVRDGANFHAVTVNSVTSVSLNPILLSVCLEENARSNELIHKAQSFALNILTESQSELGKRFAFDHEARTTPRTLAPTRLTPRGELLFEHTLGYFECRVAQAYPGGDHTIFLGEVLDAAYAEGKPLIYFEANWTGIR